MKICLPRYDIILETENSKIRRGGCKTMTKNQSLVLQPPLSIATYLRSQDRGLREFKWRRYYVLIDAGIFCSKMIHHNMEHNQCIWIACSKLVKACSRILLGHAILMRSNRAVSFPNMMPPSSQSPALSVTSSSSSL